MSEPDNELKVAEESAGLVSKGLASGKVGVERRGVRRVLLESLLDGRTGKAVALRPSMALSPDGYQPSLR